MANYGNHEEPNICESDLGIGTDRIDISLHLKSKVLLRQVLMVLNCISETKSLLQLDIRPSLFCSAFLVPNGLGLTQDHDITYFKCPSPSKDSTKLSSKSCLMEYIKEESTKQTLKFENIQSVVFLLQSLDNIVIL